MLTQCYPEHPCKKSLLQKEKSFVANQHATLATPADINTIVIISIHKTVVPYKWPTLGLSKVSV